MLNTRFAAPIPGVGTSGRRAEKSLVNTNVPVYSGFTCRLDWDFKTNTTIQYESPKDKDGGWRMGDKHDPIFIPPK